MISRRYLTRQASALIEFAKSTNNSKLAAVLVNRAADLKAQLDETTPPVDPSPHAPDIDPPAQSSAWRRQMTEQFTTPQVFIRRHTASQVCDVVVSVRGQEIILRCPDYSQAMKWARLECKSYKISEPEIEPLTGLDDDKELPLFLRPPETTKPPRVR